MSRFAEVLAGLVNRQVSKLKWVTVQNEPNRTKITQRQYEAQYRRLDAHLRRLGVRKQLHLMGGDLVGTVSPLGQTQEQWFRFLATKMADILDAYSCHVYFKFDELAKLECRLQEVRNICNRLPKDRRRPLYVTEYAVRGDRKLPNGKLRPEPGNFQGGPLVETNINAFQHAWFALLAANLGYHGLVKWDAYFGLYEPKGAQARGTQAYGMIGHPKQGWPLRPSYELMRLLTKTVKPGWKVVAIKGPKHAGSKLLAGYLGPAGERTIVGLDTAGARRNSPSPTEVSYTIDGLPKNRPFRRLYWNRKGGGKTTVAPPIRSDKTGTLTVKAPLHSVFAITTLDTN